MIVMYVGFKMKLVEAAMEKEETLSSWSCQTGPTYYIGSMNWRIILLHHLQILGSRSSLLKSIVFSLIGQSTNKMVLCRKQCKIL